MDLDDRGHEYWAYMSIGFTSDEIAEFFGVTEKEVERAAYKWAMTIHKDRLRRFKLNYGYGSGRVQ